MKLLHRARRMFGLGLIISMLSATVTFADGQSDTTSATLIVTATPNPSEMDAVQAYIQGVLPLLMAEGGTLIKALEVDQVVHGRPSGVVLVMNFPSGTIITDFFSSDAYGAFIETRERGFDEFNILVASDM